MEDESLESLEARLDGALHSVLTDSPVDAHALLRGTRHRARQVRQRRLVAVAGAAALVLAVPVGYEVVNPQPANTVATAMVPSTSAKRPTPSPTPKPPRRASLAIPDSLAFTADELPAGLTKDLDIDAANQPTVSGQQCQSPDAEGLKPIAGHQWQWVDQADRHINAAGVNLIITRWAAGNGSTAFEEMTSDTGFCRWAEPQTRRPFEAPLASDSWASSSRFSTLRYGRAAVLVGDLIAGVEVSDPAGEEVAAERAEALAVLISQRLQKVQ